MRLGLVQMRMTEKMEDNFAKTRTRMKEAGRKGVDFLFFPEVQATPFFPQYTKQVLREKYGKKPEDLALSLDDPQILEIRKMAKEEGLFLSPNFYIEENGKYYDMSLVIDDHGELIETAKMVHITQAPCFYEQDYYTPSEEGFKVVATPWGKIGIVICFDRHLPESIRTCALRGAQLVIIPTANTKAEPLELFEWEIRVQAYQNQIYVAMCNRTGQEDQMTFAGESLIAGPAGELVAKAGEKEGLLTADIDLSLADQETVEVKTQAPSYLSLRRPDLYQK